MTGPDDPGAAGAEAHRSVAVVGERGLHARAAAMFARVAARFDAEITVATKAHTVSALSIMGLLMLAATAGTRIDIRAGGPAAAEAVDALARLVESGFVEDDAAADPAPRNR